LPPGQYTVSVSPPEGWLALAPATGQSAVTVSANLATNDVDFGFSAAISAWQNPEDRYDVNNDGRISALDALQVINALNFQGPGVLIGSGLPSPPYVDVNGDGRLSALDALLVINILNTRAGGSGGEGETGGGETGGSENGGGETGGGENGGSETGEGETSGGARRLSEFQSSPSVTTANIDQGFAKVQPANLFSVSFVSSSHIDSSPANPSDLNSLQCCCGGCSAVGSEFRHSGMAPAISTGRSNSGEPNESMDGRAIMPPILGWAGSRQSSFSPLNQTASYHFRRQQLPSPHQPTAAGVQRGNAEQGNTELGNNRQGNNRQGSSGLGNDELGDDGTDFNFDLDRDFLIDLLARSRFVINP